MNYKLLNDQDGKLRGIFEPTLGFIPLNEDNTDYQKYLKWVAEGNQPEPADEPN
jgi:hypothetical protein